MKYILNNFLRGLIFILPVAITVYIIVSLVQWANHFFNNLFGVNIPGLGIIAILILITIIGFLFSRTFIRPIIDYFEQLLSRVPLVKIIYTSLKELTEAFVGDKKKFNNPVLVDFSINERSSIKRVGFITQENLEVIGLHDMVSVYCPHSYNISGNLYIVPAHTVTPLDVEAAEVMKYAMSGGITNLGSGF